MGEEICNAYVMAADEIAAAREVIPSAGLHPQGVVVRPVVSPASERMAPVSTPQVYAEANQKPLHDQLETVVHSQTQVVSPQPVSGNGDSSQAEPQSKYESNPTEFQDITKRSGVKLDVVSREEVVADILDAVWKKVLTAAKVGLDPRVNPATAVNDSQTAPESNDETFPTEFQDKRIGVKLDVVSREEVVADSLDAVWKKVLTSAKVGSDLKVNTSTAVNDPPAAPKSKGESDPTEFQDKRIGAQLDVASRDEPVVADSFDDVWKKIFTAGKVESDPKVNTFKAVNDSQAAPESKDESGRTELDVANNEEANVVADSLDAVWNKKVLTGPGGKLGSGRKGGGLESSRKGGSLGSDSNVNIETGQISKLKGTGLSVYRTFSFTGLNHVAFCVESLERSLEFYCDILGLTSNIDRPDLPYRGAWLFLGNNGIHVMEVSNPDPATGRPDHGGYDRHACLNCVNIEGVRFALDKAGIPYQPSPVPSLFCRDPDGNGLEFIEVNF